MDLRTVREDLLGDNYKVPSDFCKDMRLIFQNSKNFNTNKRSRVSIQKQIFKFIFIFAFQDLCNDGAISRHVRRTHEQNHL